MAVGVYGDVRPLLTGALTGAVLFLIVAVVTYTVPPLLLRDAPVPAALTAHIEDARRSIRSHSRVFPRPLHARFFQARCFDDGMVALYFEEWVPPYLGVRYAVAVGPREPVHGVYSWGGGYHLAAVGRGSEIEDEFRPQLGDEVGCA